VAEVPAERVLDTESDGGPAGWGSRSDVVGWIVALAIGLLSLGVAIASVVYTWTNDRRVERRLDAQEEQQFAVYVDLGAVPSDVYNSEQFVQRFGEKQDDEFWWAVINPSPVAIREVWAEGPKDEFIRIGEIQRCTLYVLHFSSSPQLGFQPSSVHFKDPQRDDWRLSDEGELTKQPYEFPSKDVSGDDNGNAQDMPMGNCA
jgi:hypothetical protein